ncbi:MAG: substrate-binding domain-containing protein [Terricaulis sp.]
MRGDFTFQAGADLAPQILNLATPPTALICANDDMAIGALLAAHRLGIVVPDQLSVTGFDDTPVSGVVWPPLTTVHQPITDMGARAVELIVEQLRSPSPRSAGGFRLLPHAMVIPRIGRAARASASAICRSGLPASAQRRGVKSRPECRDARAAGARQVRRAP